MADATTSIISLEEAYMLYKGSALFRAYMKTGYFTYRGRGVCALVERRAMNIPERLEFEVQPSASSQKQIEEGGIDLQYFARPLAFRDTEHNTSTLAYAGAGIEQYREEHMRKLAEYRTANELLVKYMNDKHWNRSIFQERTLLSSMDYTRVHNSEHVFKLETYMAMAVGLQLSITEFQNVIRKAGLCLVDGRTPDDAYAFILATMNRAGIDACNDFLTSVGADPLGTRERDAK